MSNTSEVTTSLWMVKGATPAQPPLTDHTFADVCVIGAGIAGMTTAYLLTQAGRAVVVLEDGPVGGGQTQRTTAHLSNAIDDRYDAIERIHGREGARLAAESHTAAIDCIEAIVREEGIECDFERLDGYLFTGRARTCTYSTANWPPHAGRGSTGLYLALLPLKHRLALLSPRAVRFVTVLCLAKEHEAIDICMGGFFERGNI